MNKRRGATLIEMLLVMGIASVIMVSVGYLIRTGVDYYFYSTTQLEVQRNSLLSLNLLTQELTSSTYESVFTDNNLPNPGFVFAVSSEEIGPYASPGSLPKRGPNGNLEWTHMVAYYIAEIDGVKVLMRKTDSLVTPTLDAPDPIALGFDIPHFMGLPDGSNGRVMARHISKMETEELTDGLEITMTSEINEGRNWLEMDVSTTIVPRN